MECILLEIKNMRLKLLKIVLMTILDNFIKISKLELILIFLF